MATLEVICGPMFSEKSRELLRLIKRQEYARRRVLAIKPKLDDRNFGEIATRAQDKDGNFVVIERYPAEVVETAQEIHALIKTKFPQVLVFDEAQFFDEWFFNLINELLMSNRKLKIIVSGLNMNAWGDPFREMPRLMAIANKIRILNAICFKCGSEKATMTYKREEGTGKVQTGDAGLYEARCRECWTPPPKTKS